MAPLRALLGVAALYARGTTAATGVAEDASAFVQVGVESFEHDGRPGGVLNPRRLKRAHVFPLTEAITFPGHFVGSAAFTLDVMGFHVHCYDIAMYLNESSPLWHPTKKHTRKERMETMLGNVFFEMVAHSKFVNNQNMAKFVDRLEFFAQEAGVKDYKQPIEDYRQAYLSGPKVTRGTHIILFPSKEGVRPIIGGHDMGLIESDFLGKVIMEAYLGSQSDLPEFRDNVFAQLGTGKPEEVTDPAEVNIQAGGNAWGLVVIIVVVVCGTVCLGCGIRYCWRRRKQQEALQDPLAAGAR